MAPDAVAALTYSIVKDRDVLDYMKGLLSSPREVIQRAIDDLQFDPRPQGHVVDKTYGIEIIRITVDGTSPKHSIRYIVMDKDERVRVIAIIPIIFSDKGG